MNLKRMYTIICLGNISCFFYGLTIKVRRSFSNFKPDVLPCNTTVNRHYNCYCKYSYVKEKGRTMCDIWKDEHKLFMFT